MKKFLFVFILLVILGGAVFFLGWAQLTVPPGSYGIMRSKTHGLDSQVIRDGKFRWVWYKLLPTNVEISVYTIAPVRRSIKSSGSLSSGQVYAALAGLDADFSWEIAGELEFSLKPDYLPEFIARENITDNQGLQAAGETLAGNIETLVLQRLKAYADGDEENMENILLSGTLPELNSEIEARFPEIENLRCAIQTVRYPDFALYQSVKNLYREYLAAQNSVLNPELTREAETRVNTRLRLDELARYGELLTQYPVLLQYLALEKGIPPANIETAPVDR